MSVFIALGTTACAGTEQEPNVPPVNPNPPIINPIDPDKPDPDKPDQPVVEKTEIDGQWDETGDYPVFNLTDKSLSKFVKTTYYSGTEKVTEIKAGESYRVVLTLTDSENYKFADNVVTEKNFTAKNETENPGPTPVEPEPEKPLSYDEKIQFIETAIDKKVRYVIPENSENIKYLALDCKSEDNKNYADALVSYVWKIGSKYYDMFSWIRTEMETEYNEANLKNKTYKPKGIESEPLITYSAGLQDNRTDTILKKLKADDVINYLDNYKSSYSCIANGSGNGTNEILHCGVTNINVYRIDREKILRCQLAVKSDGATKDFIGDHLINGEVNKTYLKTDYEEFIFSPNAIYIASEFQNSDNLENVN